MWPIKKVCQNAQEKKAFCTFSIAERKKKHMQTWIEQIVQSEIILCGEKSEKEGDRNMQGKIH